MNKIILLLVSILPLHIQQVENKEFISLLTNKHTKYWDNLGVVDFNIALRKDMSWYEYSYQKNGKRKFTDSAKEGDVIKINHKKKWKISSDTLWLYTGLPYFIKYLSKDSLVLSNNDNTGNYKIFYFVRSKDQSTMIRE